MTGSRESRVLVIEDVRTFRFQCTYARTLDEAEQLLFRPEGWDEVWFDHDMTLRAGGDTTYDLALRLEEQAHLGHKAPIGKVFVHTANPVGGDRLMAALNIYNPVRVRANDYLAEGEEPMYYNLDGVRYG